MNEAARAGADTAGGLLRAAREKQGLHIAALAAAIKVAPRKLDALENNRWDELPDATFTRALAQTVCRTLKVDAKPVLDLLPAAGAGRLENVAGTLNTPFRERGHAVDQGVLGAAVRPMVWAGGLLLLAALAVLLAPAGWWSFLRPGDAATAAQPSALPASEPSLAAPVLVTEMPGDAAAALAAAASAASAPGLAAAGSAAWPASASAGTTAAATSTTGAAASSAAQASTSPVAAPGAPGPVLADAAGSALYSAEGIQMKAVQASWVEARDAQGRVLVARLLAAGEDLAIEGEKPIRLVIGNAAGVELRFRQKPVDLQALTRDNVARLQLP